MKSRQTTGLQVVRLLIRSIAMALLPKPNVPPLVRRSLLAAALGLSAIGCSDDTNQEVDANVIAPQPPPQPDAMTPDAIAPQPPPPDAGLDAGPLPPQPPPVDAGVDAHQPPPPQPPPRLPE